MNRETVLALCYSAKSLDAVQKAKAARSEYLHQHPDDQEVFDTGEMLAMLENALSLLGNVDECSSLPTKESILVEERTDLIEQLRQVRRATGMPVLLCRDWLSKASPSLRERLLLAAKQRGSPEQFCLLHDPIEDDPKFQSALREATIEAEAETSKYDLWTVKQRILREKYGIQWFSPAEMNPGVHFHRTSLNDLMS